MIWSQSRRLIGKSGRNNCASDLEEAIVKKRNKLWKGLPTVGLRRKINVLKKLLKEAFHWNKVRNVAFSSLILLDQEMWFIEEVYTLLTLMREFTKVGEMKEGYIRPVAIYVPYFVIRFHDATGMRRKVQASKQ